MSGNTMERLRTDWANQGIPDAEYCFSMASNADLDLSLAQFQEKFEPLARMSQYGRLLYENATAVQAAAAAKARLHEYIAKLPMPTKEEPYGGDPHLANMWEAVMSLPSADEIAARLSACIQASK